MVTCKQITETKYTTYRLDTNLLLNTKLNTNSFEGCFQKIWLFPSMFLAFLAHVAMLTYHYRYHIYQLMLMQFLHIIDNFSFSKSKIFFFVVIIFLLAFMQFFNYSHKKIVHSTYFVYYLCNVLLKHVYFLEYFAFHFQFSFRYNTVCSSKHFVYIIGSTTQKSQIFIFLLIYQCGCFFLVSFYYFIYFSC